MRIQLNEEQFTFIRNRFNRLEIGYEPLRDELLDHICCSIEHSLQNGMPFNEACEKAFAFFGKDEIKELQDQTIELLNPKSQFMKSFPLIAASILFLLAVIAYPFLHNHDHHPANWYDGEASEINTADDLGFVLTLPVKDPPSIQPLPGELEVTSAFGYRQNPFSNQRQLHTGIDLKARKGTPVVTTSDGTVKSAFFESRRGNHIIIEHDESYNTLYAHLSEMKVKPGDQVKKGDIIGLVGSSGFSTAPHLHYEVLKHGKPIDPKPYFQP